MKRRRDTAVVLLVALVVRVAIVWWARWRFPPAADGVFYDRFADRLAHGLGYTVAWDDGVVTYAAHYPVGYPALLALPYRLFGHTAVVAMGLNALLGVAASACGHRLALREMPAPRALVAGLVLAIHPALLLYTPAIMTEGVSASLLVIALACTPGPSGRDFAARTIATGIFFGIATLVRPQLIAAAPLVVWAIVRKRRIAAAAITLGVALVVVAPWTARNCWRMHRCALVSVNGGWNLMIGVQTVTGAWAEMVTPPECTTVWDEAEKDLCFERAARSDILHAPVAWLAKAPKKLAMTFDGFIAGPVYLYRSNPARFDMRAVVRTSTVEVIFSRLVLAGALVASVPMWRTRIRRTPTKRRLTTGLRLLLALAGVASAAMRTGWPAYGLLGVACLIREKDEKPSPIRRATGCMVLLTMVTHAVFFGAGRYGLLVVPLVTLAAFSCVRPKALSASDS